MRILMTGATGVIGSRLAPALAAAGHDVTAALHAPTKGGALEARGVKLRSVDLFKASDVRAAVAGHDVVINLATHIPPTSLGVFLPGAWHENDRIRRIASALLVDEALAAGVQRFVQESFAPIYDDHGDDWIDERAPMRPTRYNRSVLDAEASARRFTERGGIGIVLRFAAFYGPDAFQLGDMIAAVRRGWMPLFGPARSYFSSVSHDDAAAAVEAALTLAPGIYNVCDDEPLRHRDFADALAAALGVPTPRLPPAWTAHLAGSIGRLLSRSLRISNAKLRAESDWAPRYASVRDGLPVYVASFPPARPGRASRAGTDHATSPQ